MSNSEIIPAPQDNLNNNVDEVKHSGHVPLENGGERPVFEDRTIRDDAVRGKFESLRVDTDEIRKLGQDADKAPVNQSLVNTLEHQPWYKKTATKIIGTVAIGAAGAATAFGLLLPKDEATTPPEPKTEPGVSAPADPSSEPVQPSQEPEPVETEEPIEVEPSVSPELLAKYESYADLPSDQFNQLPKTEQVEYLFYLHGTGTDSIAVASIPQQFDFFVSEYARTSDSPRDRYPDVVSVNNTPEEIDVIAASNLRYAFSRPSNERENVLVAGLYDGKYTTSGEVSSRFIYNLERANKYGPDHSPGALLGMNGDFSIGGTIESYKEIQVTEDGIAYRDILTEVNDQPTWVKYYYVEALNPYIQELEGTWLIE